MRMAQILYSHLKEEFELQGSELQGKLGSWMEAGMEHRSLSRGLSLVIQLLKKSIGIDSNDGFNVGGIRDKLEKVLKVY